MKTSILLYSIYFIFTTCITFAEEEISENCEPLWHLAMRKECCNKAIHCIDEALSKGEENLSYLSKVDPWGTSPFLLAIYWFVLPTAEKLLDAGIFLENTDARGWRALHIAVDHQLLDFTKKLIHKGALLNSVMPKTQETALHLAVKKGNIEMVKLLLEEGAIPTVVDRTGTTPLELAHAWELSNPTISKELVALLNTFLPLQIQSKEGEELLNKQILDIP